MQDTVSKTRPNKVYTHKETSIKADQRTVPEVLGKSKSTALEGITALSHQSSGLIMGSPVAEVNLTCTETTSCSSGLPALEATAKSASLPASMTEFTGPSYGCLLEWN